MVVVKESIFIRLWVGRRRRRGETTYIQGKLQKQAQILPLIVLLEGSD